MSRPASRHNRRGRGATGAVRTGTRGARAAASQSADFWNLRLYVAGLTPKGALALSNLRRICEEHLAGRYRIKVIDLIRHPKLARGEQIFALPAVVRRLPRPIRKLIGDLSNTERALVGMDILPKP